MAKKPPLNIKEYIGSVYNEAPAEIISKIRVDLEPFIHEIVKNDSHELYLVGRKSRHLFHALITSRLMEVHQGINFLNVLTGKVNGVRVCIVDCRELPKEISLLADSIDEGEEKEDIINALKLQDCRVSKIFCYVANQKGIDYLTSNKIMSRDQIISVRTLSPEDYRSFNNRLETYYQSRIEPMDKDHSFETFSSTKKITAQKLNEFFKESVTKGLKCSGGEFNQAKLLNDKEENENLLFVPDTITNYNFDCYKFHECTGTSTCKSKLKKIWKNGEPEYVQVRLKAELKETESVICIMVFCPLRPEMFSLKDMNPAKCILNSNCMLKDIKYNKTRFNKKDIMCLVCPQCIENIFSHQIIDMIMPHLKQLINKS